MDAIEYSKLTPEKVMAMSEEEYLELLRWAFANPFEAGIISDEAMSHLDPDGSTTAACFDQYETEGLLYNNGETYLSDRYYEICNLHRTNSWPSLSVTTDEMTEGVDEELQELFDMIFNDTTN